MLAAECFYFFCSLLPLSTEVLNTVKTTLLFLELRAARIVRMSPSVCCCKVARLPSLSSLDLLGAAEFQYWLLLQGETRRKLYSFLHRDHLD